MKSFSVSAVLFGRDVENVLKPTKQENMSIENNEPSEVV